MSLQEARPLKEVEPQLRSMRFRGSYYSYNPVPFEGTATIDLSTGQFVGTIQDIGETADIIGENHENNLCFIKLYRRNPKGIIANDSPINYEFQKIDEKWLGSYSYVYVTEDRDSARMEILSIEDSMMSAHEFGQVTEEVSRIIAEQREKIAERVRSILEED